jgi:hypothetical protein
MKNLYVFCNFPLMFINYYQNFDIIKYIDTKILNEISPVPPATSKTLGLIYSIFV